MIKWQLKSRLKKAEFTRFLDPSKHSLSGDLEGLRDCHIENDWGLLIIQAIKVVTRP